MPVIELTICRVIMHIVGSLTLISRARQADHKAHEVGRRLGNDLHLEVRRRGAR